MSKSKCTRGVPLQQPASDDESTVTEVTAALATCAAAEAMVHVLDVNCLEASPISSNVFCSLWDVLEKQDLGMRS